MYFLSENRNVVFAAAPKNLGFATSRRRRGRAFGAPTTDCSSIAAAADAYTIVFIVGFRFRSGVSPSSGGGACNERSEGVRPLPARPPAVLCVRAVRENKITTDRVQVKCPRA